MRAGAALSTARNTVPSSCAVLQRPLYRVPPLSSARRLARRYARLRILLCAKDRSSVPPDVFVVPYGTTSGPLVARDPTLGSAAT